MGRAEDSRQLPQRFLDISWATFNFLTSLQGTSNSGGGNNKSKKLNHPIPPPKKKHLNKLTISTLTPIQIPMPPKKNIPPPKKTKLSDIKTSPIQVPLRTLKQKTSHPKILSPEVILRHFFVVVV